MTRNKVGSLFLVVVLALTILVIVLTAAQVQNGLVILVAPGSVNFIFDAHTSVAPGAIACEGCSCGGNGPG